MSSDKTFSQSPYREEEERLLHPGVFFLSKLVELGCCKGSEGLDVGCSIPLGQHGSTACRSAHGVFNDYRTLMYNSSADN